MKRPSRRLVLVSAGAITAVALAVVAWFVFLRGDSLEHVAEEYLVAEWAGDGQTKCDLADQQWRNFLFNGFPFANCSDYASQYEKANGDDPFAPYRKDTVLDITVEEFSSDDGRARVGYVIEFRYSGKDKAGFDELWKGGSAVDRGTVELADVDGEWKIAGVDAG